MAYGATVDGVRGVGGAAQDVERSLEVLVPQLHLGPLTPHCRKVIHVLELHLSMQYQESAVRKIC